MSGDGPYERIDESGRFDGSVRESHEFRYKLAGTYTQPDEIVLDAACGTGYGRQFLRGLWRGVDKEDLGKNLVANLNTWIPDFPFDVLVSLETLEHLENWRNLIDIAHRARRMIILSTPIVPTVGSNQFHLQDFTKEQIDEALAHPDWQLKQFIVQNEEYGIWVLERKT